MEHFIRFVKEEYSDIVVLVGGGAVVLVFMAVICILIRLISIWPTIFYLAAIMVAGVTLLAVTCLIYFSYKDWKSFYIEEE